MVSGSVVYIAVDAAGGHSQMSCLSAFTGTDHKKGPVEMTPGELR